MLLYQIVIKFIIHSSQKICMLDVSFLKFSVKFLKESYITCIDEMIPV